MTKLKKILNKIFMVISVGYSWYIAANYEGVSFVIGLSFLIVAFIVFELLINKLD